MQLFHLKIACSSNNPEANEAFTYFLYMSYCKQVGSCRIYESIMFCYETTVEVLNYINYVEHLAMYHQNNDKTQNTHFQVI